MKHNKHNERHQLNFDLERERRRGCCINMSPEFQNMRKENVGLLCSEGLTGHLPSV